MTLFTSVYCEDKLIICKEDKAASLDIFLQLLTRK